MVIITSFVPPESRIKLELKRVEAVLDNTVLGLGTLYVSENTLCWQNENGDGFSIGYHDISIHGISKDHNVYLKDCVYILTDQFQISGNNSTVTSINLESDHEDDDDDEVDDCTQNVTELFLIPDNYSLISVLYESIKECQELNPDLDDIDIDEEHNPYNFNMNSNDQKEELEINGTADLDMDILISKIHTDVKIKNPNENDYIEFEDAD